MYSAVRAIFVLVSFGPWAHGFRANVVNLHNTSASPECEGRGEWDEPAFFTEIPGVGIAKGKKTNWGDAIAFFSIPFAKPPVDDLALMPPVEYPTPWDGERGSQRPPKMCPQGQSEVPPLAKTLGGQSAIDKYWATGQRDCLYLNVYVPRKVGERLALRSKISLDSLPVMVFIYGGAFQTGGSDGYGIYDASDLVSKDVIVVSLNYRVGPEGFLAHPAMLAAGGSYNLGLLDQRMAMRWISQHVGAFGGDPSRITLFGESAGAMSICFHLVSPKSYKYFHKAIMNSGGCESASVWMEKSRAEAFGLGLAAFHNCSAEPLDSLENLQCLRDSLKNYRSLTFGEWAEVTFPFGHIPDEAMALTPVVDMTDDGITAHPTELIEIGMYNRVPILTGTNRNEGDLFNFLNPVKYRSSAKKENFIDVVYHLLGPDHVEEAYAVYGPIGSSSLLRHAIANFLGDGLFVCPTRNFVKALTRYSKDVYMYRFMQPLSKMAFFKQILSAVKKLASKATDRFDLLVGILLGSLGVPHTMDLFFVFNNANNPNSNILEFQEQEKRMAQYFQTYWTQFAKTGNPNAPGLPDWLPYGSDDSDLGAVLRLVDPPTMHAIDGDAEVDIELRCAWWASRPDAMRTRTKPWQVERSPTDLGTRCCCDTAGDRARCARAYPSGEKPDTSLAVTMAHGEVNWRSHCPKIRFAPDEPKVHTRHDPLACTTPTAEVAKRCCCVSVRELKDQDLVSAFYKTAKRKDHLCLRLGADHLNWRDHCPKLCIGRNVEGTLTIQTCLPKKAREASGLIRIQSHNLPVLCHTANLNIEVPDAMQPMGNTPNTPVLFNGGEEWGEEWIDAGTPEILIDHTPDVTHWLAESDKVDRNAFIVPSGSNP